MRRITFLQLLLSIVLCCVNGVVFATDNLELPPADAQRAVNVTDEQTERVRKARTLQIERLELTLVWVEEILKIGRDELSIIVEAAGTDNASELDLARRALTETYFRRNLEIESVQTQIEDIKSKMATLDDSISSDQLERERIEPASPATNVSLRTKKFLSRKFEMLSKREARLTDEAKDLKVEIKRLQHRSTQMQDLQREVDSRQENFFEIRHEIERIRVDLNRSESR